jgi:nucleoside-diphosphate-sugar epimerase
MATLIIGGTGFIGARLAERFASQGEEVVCFDLYPNYEKVSHLGDSVKVIAGDVTRIEHIIDAVQEYGIKRIVNLAAVLVAESEARLYNALHINFMGMNNVFEAARMLGVPRVVYASSIAVYGLQSSFGDRPVTEEDICQPTTAYGAHKLWTEFMAKKYTENHGLNITGLRIAAVSGPGRKTGISAWTSTYIDRPAVSKPVDLPLRSDQRVLITYVDDTAETFFRMSCMEELKFPVYNSFAYSVTVGELGKLVQKFFPEAEIRFNEEAADFPLVYNWSSEKIEKEIGFKPQPIEEMIRKHINEVRKKSELPEI